MFFRKNKQLTLEAIEFFREVHKRKELERSLIVRDLRRIRVSLLEDINNQISKSEASYRSLAKKNYLTTHPELMRRLERKLILRRFKYAAQIKGKTKDGYSIKDYIETLAVTSDYLG